MKIVDYKIIRNTSETQVEKEVAAAVKEGWQPHGSLVYAPADDETQGWFYQPLVRYDIYEN